MWDVIAAERKGDEKGKMRINKEKRQRSRVRRVVVGGSIFSIVRMIPR